MDKPILRTGLAIAGIMLIASGAQSQKQMRPGFGTTHLVPVEIDCRLLDGAATSAPAGVAPGTVQQILVRSGGATLNGGVTGAVQLVNGRSQGFERKPSPTLYQGQWVSVGEVVGGRSCSATLLRIVHGL